MFGLMRTSTHRQRFIELSQSYRQDLHDGEFREHQLAERLHKIEQSMIPEAWAERGLDDMIVSIRVSNHLSRFPGSPQDTFVMAERMLREKLCELIYRPTDTRGDLRDTAPRRSLYSVK